MKSLVSCWKRANSFAKPGTIDNKHPLAPAWSNCKMFLDAQDDFGTEKEQVEELVFSMRCLDWFAGKVEVYSKENMLKGDDTVAAILHEWKDRMVFDPVIANSANPPQSFTG